MPKTFHYGPQQPLCFCGMWIIPSKTRSLMCSFPLSYCRPVLLWDHNGSVISISYCLWLHCGLWNQWKGCTVPTTWCASPYRKLNPKHVTRVFWRLSHHKSLRPIQSCDLTRNDFFLWSTVKHYVFSGNPTSLANLESLIIEAIRTLSVDNCGGIEIVVP